MAMPLSSGTCGVADRALNPSDPVRCSAHRQSAATDWHWVSVLLRCDNDVLTPCIRAVQPLPQNRRGQVGAHSWITLLRNLPGLLRIGDRRCNIGRLPELMIVRRR
jgi:hypothetical protein